MTQNNPFQDLFDNNFAKSFGQLPNNPFDFKDIMETSRKNAIAFSQAGQIALESAQAIAQRQGEIVSQIFEENSNIAKELLGEGSPEQKMAKNADMSKKLYEKTVSNMKEISDMINKSSVQAGDVLSKRVSASMTELKSTLEKAQKKAA